MGLTHPLCARRQGVDGVISVLRYEGVIRSVLKHIKYRFVYSAFSDLFNSLDPAMLTQVARFRATWSDAFLQPVPLHPTRLRSRGFNQALYIAEFFSKLLRYEIVSLVEKSASTPPQAQMGTRYERHTNVKDVFNVYMTKQKELEGKNIIIVDDVVTSGNTVSSLARELKKYRAGKVFVFSLARG
ncbi:MAG: hypothetical protein RI947_702 [Candidatus Parcubacteria bacterium]|jgi:ComF family protein